MIFKIFLKKIIYKSNILHFSAKYLGAYVVFFLIKILIIRINKHGSTNLLCIGRPIFNEDIIGMARSTTAINFLIIPKEVFTTIFKIFLKDVLNNHQNYHFLDGYESQKKEYNEFLRKIFLILKKSLKINGILTANYNYTWQQELAKVSKLMGIPFIVLFKEGISPLFKKNEDYKLGYKKLVKKYSNNNFIGDKILLYNHRIKSAFLSEKINGLNPDMMEVVGIPRLDRYFNLEEMGSKISFFSFNILDKARHLNLSKKIINEYEKKIYEFHKEVILFAKENKTIDFIIKTKSNYRHLMYVKNILKQLNCLNLKNIKLINDGDVFKIIRDSYAVIGFNSTVLLEALVSKRIVLTPDFRGGEIQTFFDQYIDLPKYVNTSKQLSEYLLSSKNKHRFNTKDLKKFLIERIYIPDGKSGERAIKVILQTIKNYNQQIFRFDES